MKNCMKREKFSRKRKRNRNLPLLIVWYQWMLTERSLNQKWYPVLPNLLILFLQMALRGHPRTMLRSKSARGVSVRTDDDGAWQHRDPKTVREATRERRELANVFSYCDKWDFDVDDADIPMSDCQICSVRAMDASSKNIFCKLRYH